MSKLIPKKFLFLLPLIIASMLFFSACGPSSISSRNQSPTENASETVSPEDEPDDEKSPSEEQEEPDKSKESTPDVSVSEDGTYTSKDDVALYIHTFEHLPDNFITKKEAQALGWQGGSLKDYAPGKCIGGDHFGNYEGHLPEASGREYHECDIDTLNANSRGAKRIVYSNDGLIFYTEDHYNSFELLYAQEE